MSSAIVGRGFNDQHINETILKVAESGTLQMFITRGLEESHACVWVPTDLETRFRYEGLTLVDFPTPNWRRPRRIRDDRFHVNSSRPAARK